MAATINTSNILLDSLVEPSSQDISLGEVALEDGTLAIPSSLDTTDLPEDQIIQEFDKRKAIIWEVKTQYGREFLTYDGKWWVEFLKGYRMEAIAYRDSKIKSGFITFKEYERKGRWLFEFDSEHSLLEITKRSIDVVAERKRYDADTTEDITPYFSNIDRRVKEDEQSYLMLNTLKALETEIAIASDMNYFSQDSSNYAEYYFGSTTNHDVGFYRDRGNRIRASYDPYYVFRAATLMSDLLEYGTPDEYVVARFPSGLIQFVIAEPLCKRLTKAYGSEDNLAKRWNNTKVVYDDNFNFGEFPGFEEVLDVQSEKYVPSQPIFEYTIAKKDMTSPF